MNLLCDSSAAELQLHMLSGFVVVVVDVVWLVGWFLLLAFWFIDVVCLLFLFEDSVLLSFPGWPILLSVAQARLEPA